MSSSKHHTPGPWGLSDNGFGVYGPAPDEWGITSMLLYEQRAVAQGQGISDEEQRANARLMAAAPELLAALEQFVLMDDAGEKITGARWTAAVVAARAAAKKARGES